MASVLYEYGYKEESINIFERILATFNNDVIDVSLRSGASGIGLALTSLYLEEKNKTYLLKAEEIADAINNFIIQGKKLSNNDLTGVPIGLIDGWSGISIFYSALYAVTNNQVYFDKSIELIEKDLEKTEIDETINVMHTLDDRKRLLPYLSGGSIGIGIAIDYLNHVSGQQNYQKELNLITNLSNVKCAFNGGLFDGAGGFLLLPLVNRKNDRQFNSNVESVTKLLNLYLVKREDHLLFPGNFGYRLSDDLFSGSSGIVLAIESLLRKNNLYWLPIINPTLFYKQTMHQSKVLYNI
ncbi:lanthionine synthetase C family protein [Radiobacillus deserti]|uniref:Lanthionine synthetase C family protein n=1 Tax=Radiobacillus deserti TaxID=2594883 RepID=A0A516KCN9_9BACI|nr:lanthionine synthetase C family protein [Radiobacillus deserti]QDP39175.1 hypothetical protein FN924_02570 [Radiobacillus deserti]